MSAAARFWLRAHLMAPHESPLNPNRQTHPNRYETGGRTVKFLIDLLPLIGFIWCKGAIIHLSKHTLMAPSCLDDG